MLKGGVLLAVFGQRRPTRDIDPQAQSIANDPATVRAAITDIAATSLDDGVVFDTQAATAAAIREEDQYQAVRVSMTASLATARPSFHVDVSVGDPITPEPQIVHLPASWAGQSRYADTRSPWSRGEDRHRDRPGNREYPVARLRRHIRTDQAAPS